VTPKASLGNSAFFLVYGKEIILPSNILFPSLQLAHTVEEGNFLVMKQILDIILKLEEERKNLTNIRNW
jgi:hypothetical protein